MKRASFTSGQGSTQGDDGVEVALFWRKSSYSSPTGENCVEVASCPGTVRVRDSKRINGDQLAVAPATWSAFTSFAAFAPFATHV